MMNREASNCAICESSNVASICTLSANFRERQMSNLIGKSFKMRRLLDSEKLRRSREQLLHGRCKLEKMSNNLKIRYGSLDFSKTMVGIMELRSRVRRPFMSPAEEDNSIEASDYTPQSEGGTSTSVSLEEDSCRSMTIGSC